MSKKTYLNKKRKAISEIHENTIIAKIEIKENNVVRSIINSFENQKRIDNLWVNYDELAPNEKEIMDCQIYINDIKVDFYYNFLFRDKGIYTIKYTVYD